MTLYRFALPVLALALGGSGILMAKSGLSPSAPIQDEGRSQDRDRGGWDSAPSEFREVQKRGYHDGVEAGREDAEHHHRHANIERSRLYRHPPVPPETRDDYRDGFRRGYDSAMSHFTNRDHDHDRDDRDRDHDHPNN